jgi:GntR family transcriptional regulator
MKDMAQPAVSELVDLLAATAKRMRPGQRMPSEHQIMTKHRVSRATARAAVQELEDLFLVRRVQGTGTFASRRIDYPISQAQAPSFHSIVSSAGSEPRTVLIGKAISPVTPEIAGRLGVEAGTDTLRLERLGYIDGLEACFFQEWFNPRTVENLDVALRVIESVAEVFEAGGFSPVRAKWMGTVDIAPPQVCERLGLPRNRQTWLVESVNKDRDTDLPLMFSRAWSRLDQVRMVFGASAG